MGTDQTLVRCRARSILSGGPAMLEIRCVCLHTVTLRADSHMIVQP